jgi:hypothetical protein
LLVLGPCTLLAIASAIVHTFARATFKRRRFTASGALTDVR